MTVERPAARQLSRRFPAVGWAWPKGDHELLLKAVILDDAETALGHARTWLDRNDIDGATFRDHRLLATVSRRFGKALDDHPATPRLRGLQRHLWARAQIAMNEGLPLLRALRDASVGFALLKGASRVAAGEGHPAGRFSQDIDILVAPAAVADVLTVLEREGWSASSGATFRRAAHEVALTGKSMNFFAGQFGDVDVHQTAYHPLYRSAADDDALWDRIEGGAIGGLPVLMPSATDRAAIAIAHGSLDAHVHSDWLVDCAFILRSAKMDWDVLEGVVAARGLATAAAIALSYLRQEMGVPVPPELLRELNLSAKRAVARTPVLLRAKPRTDMGRLLNVARWLVKQSQETGSASRSCSSRGRPLSRKNEGGTESGRLLLKQDLRVTVPPRARPTALRLVLRVAMPAKARRLEFEINTRDRHVARLTYRKLGRSIGFRTIAFAIDLPPFAHGQQLTIEARPSRQIRSPAAADVLERFGAAPFEIVAARVLD